VKEYKSASSVLVYFTEDLGNIGKYGDINITNLPPVASTLFLLLIQ
jgi:hypothetical protein